jgi:hypothetical protein
VRGEALESGPIVLFNPMLTWLSTDTIALDEGCLTFDGLYLLIKRPKEVQVTYQDKDQVRHVLDLKGWDARIVLHETDHFNGVVFTSRVSKLRLNMAKKKATRVKKALDHLSACGISHLSSEEKPMSMFANAPVAATKKPSKAKKSEDFVATPGLELYASLCAVKKNVEAQIAVVRTDIDENAMDRFIEEGIRLGKMPFEGSYKGSEGKATASIQLRCARALRVSRRRAGASRRAQHSARRERRS